MRKATRVFILLIGLILVGALAFAGIFLGVTYPRPTEPGEVVILPAATPEDEIVALGWKVIKTQNQCHNL